MSDTSDNGDKNCELHNLDQEEDLPDESHRQPTETSETNSPNDSPRDKRPKVHSHGAPISSDGSGNVRPYMVAASPPKFVSFEDIMQAANGVSNMALAHEIAVDNEFRFKKQEPEANSLAKQVRGIMQRAFWDSLQEKLDEDPPDYSHALVLFQEVKEALLDLLLPHHKRFREQIGEVLDMELIKQKAEHEALNLKYYAEFVISTMTKLCAPARDEQIAKLKDINDVVPLFREIFDVMEVMKMDLANFTIQQIRPYLQQQSVEYERAKFKEFLEKSEKNDVDGLQCTKCWLERNARELYNKDTSPVAGSATSRPLCTPNNIMNTAYLELLEWPSNQVYPETVLMDEQRFNDLHTKVNWLTLISSILLITYNTVGGAITGITGFKEKLKNEVTIILKDTPEREIEGKMKNVSVHVVKLVNECLSTHGFPTLDKSRQDMLRGQLEGVVSTGHPVHKLMGHRITDFIKELLSHHKPSEVKIPAGFSTVSEELKHVCGQFLRLVSHNRAVFGLYYADILSGLLQKLKEEETDEGTPV